MPFWVGLETGMDGAERIADNEAVGRSVGRGGWGGAIGSGETNNKSRAAGVRELSDMSFGSNLGGSEVFEDDEEDFDLDEDENGDDEDGD